MTRLNLLIIHKGKHKTIETITFQWFETKDSIETFDQLPEQSDLNGQYKIYKHNIVSVTPLKIGEEV